MPQRAWTIVPLFRQHKYGFTSNHNILPVWQNLIRMCIWFATWRVMGPIRKCQNAGVQQEYMGKDIHMRGYLLGMQDVWFKGFHPQLMQVCLQLLCSAGWTPELCQLLQSHRRSGKASGDEKTGMRKHPSAIFSDWLLGFADIFHSLQDCFWTWDHLTVVSHFPRLKWKWPNFYSGSAVGHCLAAVTTKVSEFIFLLSSSNELVSVQHLVQFSNFKLL